MDSPHSQREVKSPSRERFSHKSIWIAHCKCLSLPPLDCAGPHRWYILNYSPQIMVSWSGDSSSKKFPPLLTLVPMAQSTEASGEPTQLPGAKTRGLNKSQEPEKFIFTVWAPWASDSSLTPDTRQIQDYMEMFVTQKKSPRTSLHGQSGIRAKENQWYSWKANESWCVGINGKRVDLN